MPKKYLPLAEILLGICLGFLLINTFFTETKKFENLDLGSETSPYYAHTDTFPLHLSNSHLSEFSKLKGGWVQRGAKPVLLLLGNSQTHAINQWKEGQVNFAEILYNKYKKNGLEVLTHSIPNANLQELYLLYSFWVANFPVKKVVLPVFVDDLREDGIRDVYARIITDTHFLLKDSSVIAGEINKQLITFAPTDTKTTVNKKDMHALKETVQERSETYLNTKLQQNFKSWNYRETVRGDLFTWMYKLRNTVLGINPQTKRSIIPSLKEKNLSALKAICNDAQKRGIEVYVYIPPVRNDVSPPYYETEYATAIKDITDMLNLFPNCRLKELDGIIEGKYWGTKDATAFFRGREYDFMHFQYAAHIILADSLYSFINSGE
jgi:hypothetical protein